MSDVPLREYVETLVDNEKCLREAAAKDVARALELQAREIDRRLEILNHDHARTQELLHTFQSREAFEVYAKNHLEWDIAQHKRIDQFIADHGGREGQRSSDTTSHRWSIGLIAAIAAIITSSVVSVSIFIISKLWQ